MASRKTYRNLKQHFKQDYTVLKLNDVLCPICRSILIQPVTLPCNHGFCLQCFTATVENNNLVCPICRIRIGSWLRKSKKESNLINIELWEAINLNYAQHVKNKLEGIDEDFEEESRVVVALPGEIRKEYENQKIKEEEEIKKLREAENKASEELIKQLKLEDDYKKAVMEEKVRLDEEIAKRIAAELEFNTPSTSKTNLSFENNTSKDFGPMDRFVIKDNKTAKSQIFKEEYKPPKKFSEKEYTCRVLYLGRNKNKDDVPHMFSPIIKKKIQQMQKNFENEQLNDSLECFEADLRYFKPIDTKMCSQINGKPPLKVTCKKACKNGAVKILSPSGKINFSSNCLESAFARITNVLPNSFLSTKEANSQKDTKKIEEDCNNCKRKFESDDTDLPIKKLSRKSSPRFPEKRCSIVSLKQGRDSPPFYGFDNSPKNEPEKKHSLKDRKKFDTQINIRTNGNLWTEDESFKRRLLQEQADLELAKKLQEEFNNYSHYTRSSRKIGRGSIRRQTTLDEILTAPYRVK